jgi:hypothetical protein
MTTPAQAQEREATQWRKKPVVIDAIQWDGTEAGCQRIKAAFPALNTLAKNGSLRSGEVTHWRIGTLEGGHVVSSGDWIIRGVAGEHYPCKPDIFAATYERASLSPAPAAASGEAVIAAIRAEVDSWAVVPAHFHGAMKRKLEQAIRNAPPATSERDAEDAARYRELRNGGRLFVRGDWSGYLGDYRRLTGDELDREVDAARNKEHGA